MIKIWTIFLALSLSCWASADTTEKVITGVGTATYLTGTSIVLYATGTPDMAEEIQRRINSGKYLSPEQERVLLGGRFSINNGRFTKTYGLNTPEDFEHLKNTIKKAQRRHWKDPLIAASDNLVKKANTRIRLVIVAAAAATAGIATVAADKPISEAIDSVRKDNAEDSSYIKYVELDVTD